MNTHAANIYDKLNNVHASLRKQKEDAYRTKQLAGERLRLARQDRESMEKKGNETKAQLRQLKEKAIEMKGENGRLEMGNRLLEKEFNFQHSELQSKKEKLSRLQDKRAIEANSRHHSVTAAREMLRRLRDDSSKMNMNNESTYYASLNSEQKRHKLEQAMEVDGGEELCKNLPELVKMRRIQSGEGAKEVEMRIDSLRRIVAGYQDALGGSLMQVTDTRQQPQQQGVLQQ